MRVLFVTTGLVRSGAETQVLRLARSLAQRGYQLLVVSMLPPRAFVEEFLAAGIAVESLGMRPGLPDPRAALRLRRIVQRFGPDLVHAHMVHANILARLTRLICPVPALICTAQNVYEVSTTTERPGKYSVRDLLYCITDPLAEVTTQVCKAGAERYVRIRATSARRMRLIHNAVDLSGFDPTTELRATVRRELGLEYAWVWLAVGRLEPQKDLSTLLKAFQRIHELRPESALLIVGEGRLRPALEREISDLGLDKAVCLLGMRADVSSLMAGADAYVMSSVYEGLPLVLVEAAASRLPIVATDVGGNPDVVIDGETGLLVPAGSPDSLGKAMTRLMMMPDSERRCMVEKSRARVEARFEMTRIVDQWEELYREVLERKGLGNRSTMPRALAAPIRTVGQSGCT